jgi:hypothetical protein
VNYLDLIIDPLNQEWVQSRGNATIGVNPTVARNNTIVILHLDEKNVVARDLLPMMSSMETTPLAYIESPPTPLSVRLLFTSSSSSLPNFKMEYDIKLMAVLSSSMSILEIGLLSMWP